MPDDLRHRCGNCEGIDPDSCMNAPREDLRHVHPESLLVFLRARLEEEFADATEVTLLNLVRQYSNHPDYLEVWPATPAGGPRQRFAKVLDDAIRPVMLIGLDELGEERANDWATWSVKAVMAVRDEELEQLRYERRLLGAARMVLDLIAAGDSSRWEQARREAGDLAQRIVDEIGHPVTDEPALGPGYRAQIHEWRERAGRVEAANARTRERLDELVAAGFGAVGDTLRELRAALDDRETGC